MTDFFKKILVVEPSQANRQIIQDEIRKYKLGETTGVSDIKGAVSILEVEEIDWIITPLLEDQECNGIQLLDLILAHPKLVKAKVSLILGDEDLELLPSSYEKGLLCHFARIKSKDSFSLQFEKFHNTLQQYSGNFTLIAATYLRFYLKEKNQNKTLLSFEKKLLQYFPGNPELLMNLAFPQYELGMKDKAKCSLKQAYLLEPANSEDIAKLYENWFGEDIKSGGDGESGLNILGINSAIVIDNTEASRVAISSVLKKFGTPRVQEFEHGEAAWTYIDSQKDLDLVIMNWTLPKLPGPILLQRVRHRFPFAPVVVVSDNMGNEDHTLLLEMGVQAVVKAPIDASNLAKTLTYVVAEDRLPSEAETMEHKIRQLLASGKIKETVLLKTKYMSNTSIPATRKKKIEAEFAFAEKNYEKAKTLLLEAIKTDLDSVQILNLLGKCLLKLRQIDAALQCFEKAQKFSPRNIKRLCTIALVQEEMDNKEAASKTLATAKGMDSDSEQVKETEANLNILGDKTEKAKEIMENLPSIREIIAYMNNRAVAFVKSAQLDKSIELYEKTLQSIPEKQKDIKAIVLFNFGLALAKQGEIDKAIAALARSVQFPESKVKEKAQLLLRKLESAAKTNKQLKFAEEVGGQSDVDEVQEESLKIDEDKILATLQAEPTDICCYKIFLNPDPELARIKKISMEKPRIVFRSAIQRQATGGADKEMARKIL